MPIRAQVCTWIAAIVLLAPPMAAGQGRTEREVVELILRDGPQARAIRAESEITHREQLARLSYPNPSVTYSREGAGFTEFFQAEQSLSLFGARDALSQAGVAATAAAEAERDLRLWLLRCEAAAAVARVVAGQERLESVRAHMREVERLIEILRAREREGEGSRFDRLRAEQELRDTNQVVTSAAVALAEARATVSGMLPPRRFAEHHSCGRADRATAAGPCRDVVHTSDVHSRRASCPRAARSTRDVRSRGGSTSAAPFPESVRRRETSRRAVGTQDRRCVRGDRAAAAVRYRRPRSRAVGG